MILAPSILSANFAHLQQDIDMINKSQADWFHIDIMDGCFVPNISFGFPVLESIKQHAQKTLDVHLMIVSPDRYLENFAQAGANILTVHYEACTHLHRTVSAIKQLGMQAGIALNPHTPVSLLTDLLGSIDLVCLMSVNPGFGGQQFIAQTYSKIKQLKQMIVAQNATVKIEIDGGVSLQNAQALLEIGADVLVAGNAIFKTKDPISTITQFKNIGRFF